MLRAVLQAEKRVSREELKRVAELKKSRDEVIAFKKHLKDKLVVLKAKLVRASDRRVIIIIVFWRYSLRNK